MTPRVTLYTRPGCHLCEDAALALARLRPRYPHAVDVVDITTDPALLRRYQLTIPVLAVGGREYAAPLDVATIEHALRHGEGAG